MEQTIRNNASLPLVSSNGTDLIINRDKFHDKLIDVFYNYLDALRNGSNSKLRNNFKNKMDHICRIGD